VFERLGLETTSGAGGVGIGGPPSWVGGQVAFPGPHLVDSACYDFAQAHEGPRVQGGEVVVIPWCREEVRPLREEGFPDLFLQGGIGVVHQGPRKSGGGQGDKVGVDHWHGHPRKPVDEGYGPVSHRVNWQMVPQGGDWSRGFPVERQIHGGEPPYQGP